MKTNWSATPELRFVNRIHIEELPGNVGRNSVRQLLQQKWCKFAIGGQGICTGDVQGEEWRDVPLVEETSPIEQNGGDDV